MFAEISFKRHRTLSRGLRSSVVAITIRPYLIRIIGDGYKKNMTYDRPKKKMHFELIQPYA